MTSAASPRADDRLRRTSPADSRLASFLEPFSARLRRSESRQALLAYVMGLDLTLPSKTATEIARAVPGTSSQRLQEFLTRTNWSDREMNALRVARLIERATSPGGVLVLGQVVIPKAGNHSVGAARQWRGPRGGSVNCQRLIVAHYADAVHDWPAAVRLFLPREWAEDTERRDQARVPADVRYRSVPELALELIDEARALGVPAQLVVIEGLEDEAGELRALLDSRRQPYAVPVTTVDPRALPPAVAARVQRSRHRYSARDGMLDVAAIAAGLDFSAWTDLPASSDPAEGTPQLATVEMAGGAVGASAPGLLLIQRGGGARAAVEAYYVAGLSRADAPSVLAQIRRSAAARAFYEDTARRLGLHDYEGRLWQGFHRHLALLMLTAAYRLLESGALG